ncbi:hypothetical protein EA515_19050 [Salmonella enterica subsp. enterica serovar Give]|nr:hypothetical protein [Salmonella enterica subsp. enterica serovar Give]
MLVIMKRVSVEFHIMKQNVTIYEAYNIDAIAYPVTGSDFKIPLPHLLPVAVSMENNIHTSTA